MQLEKARRTFNCYVSHVGKKHHVHEIYSIGFSEKSYLNNHLYAHTGEKLHVLELRAK